MKLPPLRRRRVIIEDGPDPIDLHVGARLRDRRKDQGISQAIPGQQLGVSFRAVQKL